MSNLETVRPLYGLIGHVYGGADDPGERLLQALADGLDQGEGWAVTDDGEMRWYAGKLAAEVKIRTVDFEGDVQKFAELTIVLVDGVSQCPDDLLKLLNQLNSQSAGWVVWLDSDRKIISCSARVPLFQSNWWWVNVLWRIIPAAVTMAEANAMWLAKLSGGAVAERNHPSRGQRTIRDTWIDGVLLGPREPVSSMGLMLTALDLAQMHEVLESRDRFSAVGMGWPLTVSLQDNRGLVLAQLREHWQSEFGLGWQFTSVGSLSFGSESFENGPTAEHLGSAAGANEAMLKSDSCVPIFGGWVVVSPLGIVRQVFLPAPIMEEVQALSQSTFGTVTGLMFAALEESYGSSSPDVDVDMIDDLNDEFEDSVHTLNLKNGFLSHSTLLPLDRHEAVRERTGTEEDFWMGPRHALVCSFGIFNPVGPTVSSLELALAGEEWVVYWVMRHPFGPEIFEIGRTSGARASTEIPRILEDCLADPEQGVLGSGCHWMNVRLPQYEDAIRRGLERFARSSVEDDLNTRCRRIIGGQCDPWAAIEIPDEQLPEIEIDDVVDLWVGLITDANIVHGHQAFMRSAWEGAKLFAVADFEGAQSVANSINRGVRERLLDDFAFRNNEGLLIQHPTS
jgi:hypothetical protein